MMRWHTLEQATEIEPPRNACVCGLRGFLTWKGFLIFFKWKFPGAESYCVQPFVLKGEWFFFFLFWLGCAKIISG